MAKKKKDIGTVVGVGVLVFTGFILNVVFGQSLELSVLIASILGVIFGLIFSRDL